LHEPKDINSAATKEVYLADGAGSGDWRRITDTEMSFSDKTKNLFGWNDISDSLYTSGSPRAIVAATRTQLTNNATAVQTDTSRLGALWNTGSSLFLINDLNAVYNLRVSMKATVAAAAGTPYVMLMELQSDSGSLVFASNTLGMKGGGYVNHLNFTTSFYLGSSINNTNLKLFITPDTNTNIYEIGFLLSRTYKES
jgi:hypothetical protein